MEKIDIFGRKFKTLAQAKTVACKLSKHYPYVFMSVLFDEVTMYRSDHLPHSDHAANDWPIGYFRKGVHYKWSDARKIRAQNAGPQYDR